MNDDLKNILLVEDEAIIALAEAQELENYGYHTKHVNNGRDAIEAVLNNKSHFNLILMDIDLGKEQMDGTETAARILKEHEIPIVFLSSHTEPEIVQKTERITSYGYVVKNSSITVIDASIKMAFKLFDAKIKEKESEEFLDSIVENIPGMIFVKDAEELRFIRFNNAGLKMLGFSLEDIIGKNDHDLFPTQVADFFVGRDREVLNNGKLLIIPEEQIMTRDGTEKYLRTKKVPIYDKNGSAKYLLGISEDITSMRKVKKSLKESERRYHSLFEHSNDAIFIIEPDTDTILDANFKACELFGYSKEQFIKMKLPELQAPEARGKAGQTIKNEFKNFGNSTFEAVDIRKDGSIFPVAVTITWVEGNDESLLFNVVRDITKQKETEEKVKNLLSEKEILLKEVHHRVKNNMFIIRNLLSMQAESIDFPEAAASCKDAVSRIESMEILYDRLYKTEHYEDLSLRDYFNQLIDEIIKMFPDTRQIKIEHEIEDCTISTKMIFPLGIILNELLTNALKYAFKGKDSGLIRILLKKEDNHVILIFEDNGIGMHIEAVEGNKGFGLTLIDLLLKQIGGNYEIDNSNGTRFIIKFDL